MAYGIGHSEEWSFGHDSVSIVGGVKNTDSRLYSGSESETKALNLPSKTKQVEGREPTEGHALSFECSGGKLARTCRPVLPNPPGRTDY